MSGKGGFEFGVLYFIGYVFNVVYGIFFFRKIVGDRLGLVLMFGVSFSSLLF